MSKILIHTIAFSPDSVSTAYLYNDIALKFKERGYDVCVLTTTPHYNIVQEELENQPMISKFGGLYYKSYFAGIKVKHIPQKKFKSPLLRFIGFIYWHFMALIIGLFERDVNVIISPSPPLTIALINIFLCKLKGSKSVYNVQEIYPDLLIESGILKSRLLTKILKKIERYVYDKSDVVTTIDEVFYDTIKNRFKDPSKLQVIPNFVDIQIYKPILPINIKLNVEEFPNNDSLKVMYAGNIGHAQDWEPFIQLAISLRYENIDFFIIGEGVLKEPLQIEITKNGLNRVHLLPYQPRRTMPSILSYSDIQFIFMSPQTDSHGFPSKIYTIMSSGKPILVSSSEKTPIVNFLSGKNCAYIVTTRDEKERVEKMSVFLRTVKASELVTMGNNGLGFIHKHYSKEVVTEKYVELASKLIYV